jgi:hypothetical protein
MSNFEIAHDTHGVIDGGHAATGNRVQPPERRVSTETKASYKTTELIAYVVAVIAVLIASAVADADTDFGAKTAFLYITALTIGYMLSRGLAKSGSREPYDDDNR